MVAGRGCLLDDQRPPPTRPPPPAGQRPLLPGTPPRPYTDVTTSNRPASSYDQTTSGRPTSSSRATNSGQPAFSTDENPSGCVAYAAAAGRCPLFVFVTMPAVAVAMTLAIVVCDRGCDRFLCGRGSACCRDFAVALEAMGMAVPPAVDVVFGRGCSRINFQGGSYGRGTGPFVAAIR